MASKLYQLPCQIHLIFQNLQIIMVAVMVSFHCKALTIKNWLPRNIIEISMMMKASRSYYHVGKIVNQNKLGRTRF